MSDVTQILTAVRAGDADAAQRLFELVYGELRQVAAQKMARESAGHTLQPTALVHEAWLRLGADAQPHWQNRAHFFAAAAEAMRRILVDRARRKRALRHGAGAEHVELDGLNLPAPVEDDQLLALDDALQRFAALDAQKAELVKLRYFVGLTTEQAARVLNISEPTAKRWWAYAKAWLYQACRESGDNPTGSSQDIQHPATSPDPGA
jgi:RNA polymerase sigma factor (TIGR02999 family)